MSDEARSVARQAYAGLLWSKQFYHYVIRAWLNGDPRTATAAEEPAQRRNRERAHPFRPQYITMPDKWALSTIAADEGSGFIIITAASSRVGFRSH